MSIKSDFRRLRDPDNWLPGDAASPTRSEGGDRRGWPVPVLGAVAVVAVLAALSAVITHRQGHPPAPANPAPSSLSNAVPWKAVKAPSSPAATGEPDGTTPSCAPANLRIKILPGINPAMGTAYVMVEVTNSGTTGCRLHDTDLGGLRWGSRNHSAASAAALDTGVTIPASRSQEYRLGFDTSCIAGSVTTPVPTRASIGGQSVRVTGGGIPTALAGCDATVVGAVTPAADATETASPFADLHADMDVAHDVVAGPLDYTITLTNTGSEAVDLAATCPTYVQLLTFPGAEPQDERYELNCAGAAPLEPGAAATFAMRIDVPDEAIAAGPIKLTWLMDSGPDAGELLNATSSATRTP